MFVLVKRILKDIKSIILLIFTTIWLGFIGFADDYIKIFKKNKGGLEGKFKLICQISLGLIIGLTLFYHSDVTIKDQFKIYDSESRI